MREEKSKPAAEPVEQHDPNELRGCITYLVLPVVLVVDGVCLSSLWGWFLMPLGLPRINVSHAVGLILIRKFFNLGVNRVDDGQTLRKDQIVMTVSLKIAVMLIGYVAHRIMIR